MDGCFHFPEPNLFDNHSQTVIQREPVAGPEGGMMSQGLSNEIQKKRGGGSGLSPALKARASKSFGQKFDHVRVHQGSEADQISNQINARAFTIGSDIFLSKNVAPDTSTRGQETMMHELTHVVQQNGTVDRGPLKLGATNTAQEQEAAGNTNRSALK